MDLKLDEALDLPVLQPPPGFEDHPTRSQYHIYDDPCSIGNFDLSQALNMNVVAKFADQLACNLLSSVNQPKVKLRTKRVALKTASFEDGPFGLCNDIYSLPIDTLIGGRSEANSCRDKSLRSAQIRHSIAVPRPDLAGPNHMTLDEVRCYLRECQSSPPSSLTSSRTRPWMHPSKSVDSETKRKSCFVWTPIMSKKSFDDERTKNSRKSLSVAAAGLKQALFSVFRFPLHQLHHSHGEHSGNQVCQTGWTFSTPPTAESSTADNGQYSPVMNSSPPHRRRELPPLPVQSSSDDSAIGFVRIPRPPDQGQAFIKASLSVEVQNLDLTHDAVDSTDAETAVGFDLPSDSFSNGSLDDPISDNGNVDFAASIAHQLNETKRHGWYWGPLTGIINHKITKVIIPYVY